MDDRQAGHFQYLFPQCVVYHDAPKENATGNPCCAAMRRLLGNVAWLLGQVLLLPSSGGTITHCGSFRMGWLGGMLPRMIEFLTGFLKWQPLLTLLIGGLLGIYTGAAGKYYADKYTDRRKAREHADARRKAFANCEQQMTELFTVLRQGLKQAPLGRTLIVAAGFKTTDVIFGAARLEENALEQKVDLLASNGFFTLITNDPIPQYRMTEEFAERLMVGIQ